VKRTPVIAVLLGLGLAACAEANGLGTLSSVQVSFATQSTTTAAAHRTAAAGGLSDTTVIGADTLVLTKVELVLRELELKRADVSACPSDGDDGDGCEKFETGPVLVSLPLTPGAQQAFAADIPAGTYAEIEFEIRKPDDGNPADQAFLQQHPDFDGVSIRITGTFNGTPFVHTTELDVEQELTLTPDLVVAEGESTNLTILVSVTGWYLVGGVLVDPATANGGQPNESAVNNNIKDSFTAFEDPDRSGSDD
jgi:hypothetical protein